MAEGHTGKGGNGAAASRAQAQTREDDPPHAEALRGVLSDTWLLYVRAHGFHWNVTGGRFRELHALFGEQYQELWAAVDTLAERLRALGCDAPGTARDLITAASHPEPSAAPHGDDAMLRSLLEGHTALVDTLHEAIALAEEDEDPGTADLLTARILAHEKACWMLRATLSP